MECRAIQRLLHLKPKEWYVWVSTGFVNDEFPNCLGVGAFVFIVMVSASHERFGQNTSRLTTFATDTGRKRKSVPCPLAEHIFLPAARECHAQMTALPGVGQTNALRGVRGDCHHPFSKKIRQPSKGFLSREPCPRPTFGDFLTWPRLCDY